MPPDLAHVPVRADPGSGHGGGAAAVRPRPRLRGGRLHHAEDQRDQVGVLCRGGEWGGGRKGDMSGVRDELERGDVC